MEGIYRTPPPQLPERGLTDVQAAVKAAQFTRPPQRALQHGSTGMYSVPHVYCGELSGSITGSVWCYGYALHHNTLVYLNMAGPRTSVEAIRANLSKGDAVNLLPDDSEAKELKPSMPGSFMDFTVNMPEARFMSMILLVRDHERFIVSIDEMQTRAKLIERVRALVDVPVFDHWHDFLWSAGQHAVLLTPCAGEGAALWHISPNAGLWTQLITYGLAAGVITLEVPNG